MTPKTFIAITSLVILVTNTPHSPAQEQRSRQIRQAARVDSESFQLPADRAMPVIELAFIEGGQESRSPDLIIFADGAVRLRSPSNAATQLSGRLPQREMQSVLHELLVDLDLLNCDTHALAGEIDEARRQLQRPVPGPDAALTVIRLHGEAGTHEIRCHALGLTASQFPHLAGVQRLFCAEQRLCNVMAVVRAGGYEVVEEAVRDANVHLQSRLPREAPLSCRHLCFADVRDDGSRFLQFSRFEPATSSQFPGASAQMSLERVLMVSVSQSPGKSPQVRITSN